MGGRKPSDIRERAYSYRTDADGHFLDGSHRYILYFPKGQLPKNADFSCDNCGRTYWRVLIGGVSSILSTGRSSHNEPLKLDSDGGLTLYIQYESPGEAKESNWLRAAEYTGVTKTTRTKIYVPIGRFVVSMEISWPTPEILDGTWTAPPVQKVK